MGWFDTRYVHSVCISFLFVLQIRSVWAGNTTCATDQLDWYTNYVGESPCITYQRLRQICNSEYQVPSFRPNTPGDNCDDQVSYCCCNTVAFQLSMLCMNCQQDHGNMNGIDAAVGTYTLYRGSCGAGTNNSLSTQLQAAVCNNNIKLDNFVYGGWDTGDWYYTWTREHAEFDHAANNGNTFTHCPDQVSSSASQTSAPPSTSTPTSSPTSSSVGTSSLPSNPPPSPSSSPNPPSSPESPPPPSSTFTSSTTAMTNIPSNVTGLSASSDAPHGSPLGASVSTGSGANPLVATTSTIDAASQTQSDAKANGTSAKSSSNVGAIIGGVVGGVAVIAAALGLLFLFRRCRNRRADAATFGTQDVHHDYAFVGNNPVSLADGQQFGGGAPSGAGPQALLAFPPTSRNYAAERSGWSDYSSEDPRSTQIARHSDAGVIIPLERTGSGRLPPAYRSW